MSPLERYIAFFESVPECGADGLERIVTDDVRFVDPFNDVCGIEAYRDILADMCEQIADLRIEVLESAVTKPAGAQKLSNQADESNALMRWRLSGKLLSRGRREWVVSGCSAVRFAPDGRVTEHIDYWDAAGQLYESFPLVGVVLRYLRRRISIADRQRRQPQK